MNIPKICTPAMVYLVVSLFSLVLVIFKGMSASSVIIKGLFVLAWTWFLNFLCVKGYKTISWFLVLLPFLLMLAMFVMAVEVVKTNVTPSSQKKNHKQY